MKPRFIQNITFYCKNLPYQPHTGNNFIQNQPLCKTLTNQDGHHQHILSHAANMTPISSKISHFTAKFCLISSIQATMLSKTNHCAKPLRIRMDITSTCFHMLLLLQLFPHMPQPWMCDPCTAPWCYTQTASYLRHTCRAYASTRAEESVIVFYAWSLDLLMRIFP